MNNFNFNRFARTFKWCFFEQRGQLLKWTAVTLIVTLAVELFFILIFKKTSSATDFVPYVMAVQASCSMSSVFVIIAMALAFSNIFAWLKNKQKRAAFLTLPATNLERWTTAVIYALIIFPVCIALAYFLGDFVRNGLFYAMGEEWMSGTKYLVNFFGGKGGSLGFDVLALSMTLWGASCYILSGTWFRKGQFVIPTIFQIALMAFLAYIVKTFHNEIADMLVNGYSKGQSVALKYTMSSLIAIVALFNFWLSYWFFKRFQIITSKWTHL